MGKIVQGFLPNLNGIFNRAPWWPEKASEDMSMEIVKVKDKDWPGIREAVDYLERQGIPESKVRAVNIYARAGEPMEVTFTLALDKADLEPEPEIVRIAEEDVPPVPERMFGQGAHGGYADGLFATERDGCDWPRVECKGHWQLPEIATGGVVKPSDKPYLVGESGPEPTRKPERLVRIQEEMERALAIMQPGDRVTLSTGAVITKSK